MLKDASAEYLSNGVLGVSCFLLICALIFLYRENKAKDAKIYELQDARIKDAWKIAEVVEDNEKILEAISVAFRRSEA